MSGIHPQLQCIVKWLTYDWDAHIGRIGFLPFNCCDGAACKNLFLAIDPGVLLIRTYAGEKQDTIYARKGRNWCCFCRQGNQWRYVANDALSEDAIFELQKAAICDLCNNRGVLDMGEDRDNAWCPDCSPHAGYPWPHPAPNTYLALEEAAYLW